MKKIAENLQVLNSTDYFNLYFYSQEDVPKYNALKKKALSYLKFAKDIYPSEKLNMFAEWMANKAINIRNDSLVTRDDELNYLVDIYKKTSDTGEKAIAKELLELHSINKVSFWFRYLPEKIHTGFEQEFDEVTIGFEHFWNTVESEYPDFKIAQQKLPDILKKERNFYKRIHFPGEDYVTETSPAFENNVVGDYIFEDFIKFLYTEEVQKIITNEFKKNHMYIKNVDGTFLEKLLLESYSFFDKKPNYMMYSKTNDKSKLPIYSLAKILKIEENRLQVAFYCLQKAAQAYGLNI